MNVLKGRIILKSVYILVAIAFLAIVGFGTFIGINPEPIKRGGAISSSVCIVLFLIVFIVDMIRYKRVCQGNCANA